MLRLLILISACLLTSAVAAEQLVQVYRAETLVATQSPAERNAAMRGSLAEVIVRVSGDTAALDHPNVRRALGQAQTYLHEFSYASTDEKLQVDGREVPAVRLLLKFSPQAVERLLRESRLSLWPANRPKLLVWQVMRDELGNLQRVPDDAARGALYQQAAVRGLPLLLPMQDLEDNLALSSEDLWNGDERRIAAASERYRPDAILAGRYTRNNDGSWVANWRLFHASGSRSFDSQGSEVASLFVQAVNTTADYFARLYAIVPGDETPGAIVMRIEEVRDFASYKQVERYLQGLAMVSRVELMKTEHHHLLVRLHTLGDVALLLSTLELGKKLFPVTSAAVSVPQVQSHRRDVPLSGGAVSAGGMGDLSAPEAPRGTLENPLIYRWQS